MSDDTHEKGVDPAEATQDGGANTPTTGPRMRPAVLIVLAHLAALAFSLQAPTLMLTVIGVVAAPILSILLLSIWWLRTRALPLRERVGGLLLFFAILVWVAATQQADGGRLLMIAAPTLTIGVVALLLLTARLAWPMRRALTVASMIVCAGVFTATRVDDVRGDIMPVLSWRWSPTVEDLFADWVEAPTELAEPISLPLHAEPSDWPEFRGPARDSRLPGTVFATDWDESPPRELWRRRVGLGWSSFTVIDDFIFTQEQRGDNEVVVCYRADTGDEMWVNLSAERFEESMGSGPRATPTFRDGRLYTLGATGILQWLDGSTGETVWKRDLKKDTRAKIPVWGFASSPLVTGDLVIVFSGSGGGKSVVAYHRMTGEFAWTAGDGTHGYSSAHLARIADVPQVLVTSNVGIQSFAPETGEMLWEHRWLVSSNPRCVQPLVVDANSILIGTAGGKGTRRLRVDRVARSWEVEEVWTTRRFRPYFNDFVYHEGYCYGFDGSRFTCIDAATGERKWTGAKYGGQVLLLPDMDALLVLSEKGNVVLLEATPEGHHKIAEFKALSGKTWNHPVIAGGRLFVRNSEEAACFDLPTR